MNLLIYAYGVGKEEEVRGLWGGGNRGGHRRKARENAKVGSVGKGRSGLGEWRGRLTEKRKKERGHRENLGGICSMDTWIHVSCLEPCVR